MQGEQRWTEHEYMSDDERRRALAHSLGVPFIMLTKDDIATAALLLIPEPLSRAHSMVAYRADESTIEVALLDIADAAHVAALHPTKKIKPRLTSQLSIKQALLQYQKHLKDVYGNALQAGNVDALILHAMLNRASHVHIDALASGTNIRYRIQGVLHDAMRISVEAGNALLQHIKRHSKLFNEPVIQDGTFTIEKDGEVVRVQVTNVPCVGGEKIALRLSNVTHGQRGLSLTTLGLHGAALEAVHVILQKRAGLIFVSGLPGSGKTSTLYAMIDQLHKSHVSIATIEQTVGEPMQHVVHMQTRPEVGLTMYAGLKAVLRTDPDVVLVDTIDSKEVAQLALDASARGILVFASIEASSASGAIEAMQELGLSEQLLETSLLGVVHVQTLSRMGDTNRQEVTLSREAGAVLEQQANFGHVLAALKEEGLVDTHAAWKEIPFYRSTNTKGIVGIHEVIMPTGNVQGTLTLVEDALFKAVQGLVSLDEVLKVAGE